MQFLSSLYEQGPLLQKPEDQNFWVSCRATRDYAGVRTARLLLLLLTCSAGMFSASSALLPSSFVMYFVTLAAAAAIDNKPLLVVVYAVVGVILGWVVAGVEPQCNTFHQLHPMI